jgi:hypothetical protein
MLFLSKPNFQWLLDYRSLVKTSQSAIVFLSNFANYFAEAHKFQYNDGFMKIGSLLEHGVLLLSEQQDPDNASDTICVPFDIAAEYTDKFLFLRAGQLVDVGKEGAKKKTLAGVGRRIKMKPKWQNDKKWGPTIGKTVEECIESFEEAFCLVNEG